MNPPTAPALDADTLLDLIRPLIVVVDGTGTMLDARGGAGGFLGYDPRSLVGRNVLDFVPAHEQHEVAHYFVELASTPVVSTRFPIPFRSSLIAADAREHLVDVIPTAIPPEAGVNGWSALIVPLAMEASASRSLDAELAGAPRATVKQLLTEELELSVGEWLTRWFLVDLVPRTSIRVVSSRSGDFGLSEPVRSAFTAGWTPWATGAGLETLLDVSTVPEPLRSAALEGDWHAIGVSPIVCEGAAVAALVRVGRVLVGDPSVTIRTNVLARVRRLLEVTTLLYGRWRESDRLVAAATTDPLTGLANRDAFTDALIARRGPVAVVYADIDRFKDVNDVFGHAVGDRVLLEVVQRLLAACRPTDLVARLGGDEFAVLLDTDDADVARRIGERMLETVSAPLAMDDGPPHVSVSLGLAVSPSGREVVERADRAMLAAKRHGRARLVVA